MNCEEYRKKVLEQLEKINSNLEELIRQMDYM